MPTEVIQRDDKFGISNTYNPYTNSMSLANVNNQRFKIPLTPSYANASVVVVSTGLVPRIDSVLNGDIVFNLYEEDNKTLIQQLIPKVVDVGSGQYPARNEINWFDIIGMQGDFMVHSDWCGKILEISGKIETCSITAEDINGINKDINGINKNIKDNYNDLLNRINNKKTTFTAVSLPANITGSLGQLRGWWDAGVSTPNYFIGYLNIMGTASAAVSAARTAPAHAYPSATVKIAYSFLNTSNRHELSSATATASAAASAYATATATVNSFQTPAPLGTRCYVSVYANVEGSYRNYNVTANLYGQVFGYTIS